MRLLWLLVGLASFCHGEEKLPRYEIRRASGPIVIDGKLDEAAWQRAAPVGDFHFNWWTSGEKEQTVAKLLWDDSHLYVSYYCYDKHIAGEVTERHGPVSRDDAVEIFVSPNPEKPRNYYGFEMNVIGTMLNFLRADWYKGPFHWEPSGVRFRTSYHGLPVKRDAAEDTHWVLELAIPWENFARDAAHTPPQSGDVWRLNLNRAGGKTNAQYSTWSPVKTEKPNFHVPEAFGWVTFVK